MNIPAFTLERQYSDIGSSIQEAVSNVIKSGQYVGGEEVLKFQDSFASLIGVKYAIGCNSGTDALVLALRALDIGSGDEVITSSFSFFATAEAVSIVGAKPVFVDINPATYLIDIDRIESKITDKTKAIIPVHLFGNPIDMSKIQSIGKKYNLKIIEDCAQATCTTWQNQKVGSLGDVGCFSFFPTKNLGAAGDGGAVTTSNERLAQKLKELAVHGSPKRYSHTRIGYNSRLDAVQAAVLNVKIKSISKWIGARQRIAENYFNLIGKNKRIFLPKINSEFKNHSWNQFVLRLPNNIFSLQRSYAELFDTDFHKNKSLRNLIQSRLSEKGINSIIYYPIPIHAQIAYQNIDINREDLIHTERVCTEVLSLPMFPEITYEEQQYIATSLNSILIEYSES